MSVQGGKWPAVAQVQDSPGTRVSRSLICNSQHIACRLQHAASGRHQPLAPPWQPVPRPAGAARPLTGSLLFQSTPLHLAAGYNRVRIVQLLLQHGADVHAKDKG